MASEMEVATSMGDNMASAPSIGSLGGRTCIEVRGEGITPEEAEGWSTSAKRVKQIMAGKENGESAAITRQSRLKTRATFAKRVAASVTKAARMPTDMPKEDTKIVMRPRGGLNVARTEVSIIMSAVMTAARVTKEEAKADTICTNAQQNIIVVSTPDERRATLYSKVKALNIGGRTFEVSAYRTAPDGTVKGVIRGIAVDDSPEEIAENIVNPSIEGAKERKIMERIEKQDDRLDRLEATSKVTNERLTGLAQTVQQMTTNIQSTIQNMMAQMQAQLQTQIQTQIQGMEAQIIAKLQQSWTGPHVQQHRHHQ
ncbi:uncharacterized protein [Dermacentor albipictus]|uniref:uncharacterized protein n=1 Tax=Dermacentor albipictus TaxID=60249 RepID=UPI0038FCD646